MQTLGEDSLPMIIYVAGYGRSGSTILQTVLGNSATIRAGGELCRLAVALNEGRICACGKSLTECSFWGAVNGSRLDEWKSATRLVQSIEAFNFFRIFRFLIGLPWRDSSNTRRYGRILRDQFQFLAEEGATAIVDSSKTAWSACFRPIALSELAGFPVKIIHLKRSLGGVLGSVSRGTNQVLEGAGAEKRFRRSRAVIGWLFSNWMAGRLKNRLGDNSVFALSHEDFLADPAGQIDRLQDFLGMDLNDVVSAIATNAEFAVGHTVGGNRMRYQKNVSLQRRAV